MENEDILENDAFDDALKSLDEQLAEHHQEIEAYDETEQEAIMYEEGVDYTPELDAEDNPEAVSYAEQAEDSDAFESHEPDEAEALLAEDEEHFAEYPTFNESEVSPEDSDDMLAHDDADDNEETDIDENSDPSSEESDHTSEEAEFDSEESHSEETDDFNLATLNQLVDEIRQESQRVTEMKDAVAEALQLIQEMSESLKP